MAQLTTNIEIIGGKRMKDGIYKPLIQMDNRMAHFKKKKKEKIFSNMCCQINTALLHFLMKVEYLPNTKRQQK